MENSIESEKLVTTEWLEENWGNPSIQVVEVSDMRDPRIYFERHIPGAVYWPWQESLWHPTDREFVSPEGFSQLMGKNGIGHDTTIIFSSTLEELQESFDARGATRDKEIVTYCRLSHRASMGWFVAVHLLGYSNVKVYDGSWTEWGNIVGYPIVNESLK